MKPRLTGLAYFLALMTFLITLPLPTVAADDDEKPTLNGTWRWTFTMPDGSSIRPKLKLKQAGEKIIGTSSFRPGTETPIIEGKITGDEVSFEVVREREGEKVVTRYTGKWSGNIIQGKVESNWNGEKQSYDWEARRFRDGVEGIWKWTTTIADRKVERQLSLKQDGETLTGKLRLASGRYSEIKEGKLKDGEVSFEVVNERDSEKSTMKYHGKLAGDTIEGKIEGNWGGKDRSLDWRAKRGEEN